jgi:diphthine methyl ester synthase
VTIANMFYFIGLGLADEKDITVKGLEIVKKAERVYLEAYTAILMVDKEKLVHRTFSVYPIEN